MGRKMKSVAKMGRKVGKSRNIERKRKNIFFCFHFFFFFPFFFLTFVFSSKKPGGALIRVGALNRDNTVLLRVTPIRTLVRCWT